MAELHRNWMIKRQHRRLSRKIIMTQLVHNMQRRIIWFQIVYCQFCHRLLCWLMLSVKYVMCDWKCISTWQRLLYQTGGPSKQLLLGSHDHVTLLYSTNQINGSWQLVKFNIKQLAGKSLIRFNKNSIVGSWKLVKR